MAAPTYPLMMPTTGVKQTEFNLVTVDAVNTLVSGAGTATELAQPYWDISIDTADFARRSARYRAWMSFIKALRGQKKIGLFYDADLPRPANYDAIVGMTKAIGGTFTGTGPVDTVTDRRTIVISGLPAAFVLLADDYIEFRQDDRHYLVSLVADSTADGSGVATIYIEPALPQLFDDAATYNLEKPCCEGYIVGVPSHSRDIEAGSISFKAKSRPV